MRLAFFTDLHLSLPNPSLNELWGKPLTGFLNWQKRAHWHDDSIIESLILDMKQHTIEKFLIGGDLINIGLPREIEKAHGFLKNIAPNKNIVFVNGNHDAYTQKCDIQMREILVEYYRPSPSLISLGEIDLITLNSGIPTPPFNATGEIEKTALLKLQEILITQTKPYFLMLHHPPIEIEGGAGHKKLVDGEKLLKILRVSKPQFILHGHTHLNSLNYFETIPIIGVASASANEKGKDAASWVLIDKEKLILNQLHNAQFSRKVILNFGGC